MLIQFESFPWMRNRTSLICHITRSHVNWIEPDLETRKVEVSGQKSKESGLSKKEVVIGHAHTILETFTQGKSSRG